MAERASPIGGEGLGGAAWIDYDLDDFRKNYSFYHQKSINICKKILRTFDLPFYETDLPWLTSDKKHVANFIFNRTLRYKNLETTTLLREYFEIYKDSAAFVGIPEEYEEFCATIGDIDYYEIKNFLELANIINGSKIFIGNQSSPMAIAIALGKYFIQEVCLDIPDCIFPNRKGIYLTRSSKKIGVA